MKLRTPGGRRARLSGLLALLTAVVALGSPWVANSPAQTGGADKPRPVTFGDCKNQNAGLHNGYDCEEPSSGGGGGGNPT